MNIWEDCEDAEKLTKVVKAQWQDNAALIRNQSKTKKKHSVYPKLSFTAKP